MNSGVHVGGSVLSRYIGGGYPTLQEWGLLLLFISYGFMIAKRMVRWEEEHLDREDR